jgi:hypothetical protein
LNTAPGPGSLQTVLNRPGKRSGITQAKALQRVDAFYLHLGGASWLKGITAILATRKEANSRSAFDRSGMHRVSRHFLT